MNLFDWSKFGENSIAVLVNTKEKFINFLICAKRRGWMFGMLGNWLPIDHSSVTLWDKYKTKTVVVVADCRRMRVVSNCPDTSIDEERRIKVVEWMTVDLNRENRNFDHFINKNLILEIKNRAELESFFTKFSTIITPKDIVHFFLACDEMELRRRLRKGEKIYVGIKDRNFLELISKETVKAEIFPVLRIDDIYYDSDFSLGN